MPEIPADALAAAERAITEAMTDPEYRTERSSAGLARAALEAATPVLERDIRERITRAIDPARIDQLADWFDDDDTLKMHLYQLRPDAFPTAWKQRGRQLQGDLRQWAKLLRGTETDEDHGH